jgi:hypothetical protein
MSKESINTVSHDKWCYKILTYNERETRAEKDIIYQVLQVHYSKLIYMLDVIYNNFNISNEEYDKQKETIKTLLYYFEIAFLDFENFNENEMIELLSDDNDCKDLINFLGTFN